MKTGRERIERRGAACAAAFANEPRLEIGQPYFIGPRLGAYLDVMAAPIVAAVHKQAGLAKGDFLLSHPRIEKPIGRGGKPLGIGSCRDGKYKRG